MKSKLTNNLGWKILSILVSIVLWMVVNSISNPSVTQTYYNIPVKLVNADKLSATGKVYSVLENTDVVSRVIIKAPRSVISEIDENDILLTADINNMTKVDSIPINFDVNIYSDQINSIKGSIDSVKLSIEDKRIKTLALQTEVTGTLTDDYMVGDITISQNVVRITGAESLVDEVDLAKVEIDVTGFTSDVGTNTDIKLYDADGNQISLNDDMLATNIKSVGVQVEVLQKKKVPISVDIKGQPADGYMMTGEYGLDVPEVEVCGKGSSVKNLDSIKISDDSIDITDSKANYIQQINIKEYLPNDIKLVDDSESLVTVTVYVMPKDEKAIKITTEDIEVVNVPDKFMATIAVDEGTEVKVSGLSKDLSGINVHTLIPVVDITKWMESQEMEELSEGFYTANVEFTLPANVKLTGSVKAVLHIVLKKDEN